MRILQVSHRVPFPLNEGGTIGIYNYTRGFAEAGHEVTFACLNGIKHHIDFVSAEQELGQFAKTYIFDIDTNVKWYKALANLFTSSSYHVSRFYHRPFKRFLINLLKSSEFDLIQVEGTFVAMYADVLKIHSKAPVVLRQHNVEHQIWERLAKNERSKAKKWYLNLLARRLKKFEKDCLNWFDAIVPVTKDDALIFKKIGASVPIFVSPAGIDTNYWKPSHHANPYYVYHIGSLEWMPNREAVLWFLDKVWPEVTAIDDRFKLFIAGKNMPDSMKNLKIDGVEMIQEVKDAASFAQGKGITVVPLLSGSGIRLKILEAMAAGKLVISTSIGAQGIEYQKGKHLLIADRPEEYIELFKDISKNSQVFDNVKEAGKELIGSQYSNKAVVGALLRFYESLISESLLNKS